MYPLYFLPAGSPIVMPLALCLNSLFAKSGQAVALEVDRVGNRLLNLLHSIRQFDKLTSQYDPMLFINHPLEAV